MRGRETGNTRATDRGQKCHDEGVSHPGDFPSRWKRGLFRMARRAVVGSILGVFCLGVGVVPAPAAAPHLVKDIATGINPFPEDISIRFLPGTRSGFFTADTPGYGDALWITDGTEAGTRFVRDFYPSLATKLPRSACEAGGIAYLGIGDDLWRSDGTFTGTKPIASVSVLAITEFDGAAFLVGEQPGRGTVLLRSDGTPEGTVPMAILPHDRHEEEAAALFPGTSALWIAMSSPDYPDECPCWKMPGRRNHFQVWKSDGTGAGTQLVSFLPTIYSPTVLGDDLVYFQWVASSERFELWRSDGTPAGTRPLATVDDMGGFLYDTTPVVADGSLYFTTVMPDTTPALWRSDGTPEGTAQVYPESPTPLPNPLGAICGVLNESRIVALDSEIVFTLLDGSNNRNIWGSDGTTSGTRLLGNWTTAPSTYPDNLAAANGRVFFGAGDGWFPWALWVTDGTPEGTHSLFHTASGEINPPSAQWMSLQYMDLVPLGNWIYFQASDGIHGFELWKSDGTLEGTQRVKDLVPPSEYGSSPTDFFEAGGGLVFKARTPAKGREFWGSDGTAEGTRFLRDISSGTTDVSTFFSSPDFALWNSVLFFTDWLSSDLSLRLWRTDGSPLGTQPLFTFSLLGATEYGQPRNGLDFWTPSPPDQSALLLAFHTSNRPSAAPVAQSQDVLYRTDGTPEGSYKIKDGWTQYLGHGGGKSVFLSDPAHYDRETTDGMILTPAASLWASNGEIEGTTLLAELPPGDIQYKTLGEVEGLLYFGISYSKLEERWGRLDYFSRSSFMRTDGTPQGTFVLIDDLVGTPYASGTQYLGSVHGCALLSSHDYQSPTTTIWSADGTPNGTVPLYQDDILISPFQEIGGRALFTVLKEHRPNGSAKVETSATLWATDNTPQGTHPISEIPLPNLELYHRLDYGPVVVGKRIVFFCEDTSLGSAVWSTDGTSSGTFHLRNLSPILTKRYQTPYPTGVAWILEVEGVTLGGNRFVFPADDGIHGMEMWVTDGTPAGTRLLRDILPGPLDSGIDILKTDDERVFFSANDGETGYELWVSDGTPLGTVRVTDLYPGPGGIAPSASIVHNGTLYFSADDGSGIAEELWALPLSDLPMPTQTERDILPRILNQPGAPAVGDQNADAFLDVADFIRARTR